MADRPPADVLLRDLGDLDRRLHARVRAGPLERVLQRKRVEQRREHARVVAGGAVHAFRGGGHAAVDVPAADDDRDLDAVGVHLHDLRGERVDRREIHAVLARRP